MDVSRGYHPEWGNPITKEHTWYALTDGWILAPKFRRSKIQFAKHMKLKKNKDQSVDTLPLLRIGNKTPMEGVTETKFGAKTEGKTIQRLSHPGSIPYTTTKPPDTIAYASKILLTWFWYRCLLWGYASAWQIQKWMLTTIYWMEHKAPNRGARESTQGAKGICNPIGGTTIWNNQYPPGVCVSSCICIRRWPSWPSVGGEDLGIAKNICPNTGKC